MTTKSTEDLFNLHSEMSAYKTFGHVNSILQFQVLTRQTYIDELLKYTAFTKIIDNISQVKLLYVKGKMIVV